MIRPGLVSITFRQLSPREIIDLVQQAGLQAIEWGGDVHVPPGDVKTAQEVRQMTADAGLAVAAYGSYYRLSPDESFDDVLASAVALGAPTIRVWAGRIGSADADDSHWQAIIEETRRVADLAARENVRISFEYHGNTLTDTLESALRLLREVDHANVFSLWQPRTGFFDRDERDDLKAILPHLTNLHVFWWGAGGGKDRKPLAEGTQRWKQYFEVVQSTGRDHYALMEFVRDDSPQQFLQDAAALKRWLSSE